MKCRLCVFLGLGLLVLSLGCSESSRYMCQMTPSWERRCEIQARYLDAGVIILRNRPAELEEFSDPTRVYAYRIAEQRFELVDSDVWEKASGAICETDDGKPQASTGEFSIDANRKLLFHYKPVPDQTRTVLFAKVIDSRTVVVLTCSRYRPDGLLFGGLPARGPYLFQYFDRDSGKAIGAPNRLPFADNSELVRLCISEDKRLIIFVDGLSSCVCIVPVDIQRR